MSPVGGGSAGPKRYLGGVKGERRVLLLWAWRRPARSGVGRGPPVPPRLSLRRLRPHCQAAWARLGPGLAPAFRRAAPACPFRPGRQPPRRPRTQPNRVDPNWYRPCFIPTPRAPRPPVRLSLGLGPGLDSRHVTQPLSPAPGVGMKPRTGAAGPRPVSPHRRPCYDRIAGRPPIRSTGRLEESRQRARRGRRARPK